jgi:acetyl-CoA C-acetyltransferase
MTDAVIVSAVRTPIGKYGGSLRDVPADALAVRVLTECVRRAGADPALVEDVVLGQCYQNGEAANLARLAALRAGFPESVCGVTLDRRCASGLTAIADAAMAIQVGACDVVVAGGAESMSNAEYYVPGVVRWGLRRGSTVLHDRIAQARVNTNPSERYGEIHNNLVWAENVGRKHGISRERQDEWALRSHRRAQAAIERGLFAEESIPVDVNGPRGQTRVVAVDEHVRADTTLESLAKLASPLGGTCTAGNSSGENDGAAALLLMSAARARERGLTPLGTFRGFAVAGVDPRYTGDAVVPAMRKALARADVALDDVDLVEINEAFASQVLANLQELGLTGEALERVNVNGSGISLGHPVGCTGARIVVTLLHEMRRRRSRWGVAALCVAGGMGCAAVIEAPPAP